MFCAEFQTTTVEFLDYSPSNTSVKLCSSRGSGRAVIFPGEIFAG